MCYSATTISTLPPSSPPLISMKVTHNILVLKCKQVDSLKIQINSIPPVQASCFQHLMSHTEESLLHSEYETSLYSKASLRFCLFAVLCGIQVHSYMENLVLSFPCKVLDFPS